MRRPRLLDLFCCQGGAAMGYHRAGFDVVGVDKDPQPRFPFEVVEADALEYLREHGGKFDAIHASPPCQRFTAYRRRGCGVGDGAQDLIAPTRELLEASGKPWVIENVPGAPLREPTLLCGSMFGLDVRRHRLFETSFELLAPQCAHHLQRGSYPQATNRRSRRRTVEVGVWRIPLGTQRRAMGIEWMDLPGLSQAIPPAYTELIGRALRAFVRGK